MQYATLCFRDYQNKEIISGTSQRQNQGTHKNLNGANDWAGRTGTDRVDLLAPFDCVVKSIATFENAVFFESKEEVIAPVGKSKVWFMCAHMQDQFFNQYGLKVGKEFKQGDPCYMEGNKGIGGGYHIHMEQGLGKFNGASSPYYKSNDTYIYDGKKYTQYYPNCDGYECPVADIFYLKDVELVKASNGNTILTHYPNFKFVPKEEEIDWESKYNEVKEENEELKAKIEKAKEDLA